MFSIFSSFWQFSAAGLGAALWASVWQWGLGVGLIIILLAAAYLSPLNKRYFLVAAAVIAVGLFVFGRGQLTEHAICEAKIKYIYLKAHPSINAKNITKRQWTVSPTWQLGDKSTYGTVAPKSKCGDLQWGCS